MDAGIRLMVKSELGLRGSADKQMRTETLTQTIASEMPTLTPAQLESLRKGDLTQIGKDIELAGTEGAKKALEELKKLHANDAIITKDGITTFDKGDILVAAQQGNVKLGEDLDASIATRTETLNKSIVQNTNTTTNTTAMRPVSLKLDGNINVNNGEAKMNGQDFLKLLQMNRGVALETGKLLNDAMSLGA
jgi:hypothetical protein